MKDPNFEKWQETLAQELKIRGIDETLAYNDNWLEQYNSHYTATEVANMIKSEI